MATGNKTVDEAISSIEEMHRAASRTSKMFGKLSEDLSKVGVDKLTDELKKAAKQAGVLNDEQLDVIKSLRDFEKVVDTLEAQHEKMVAAMKKRDRDIAAAGKNSVKVERAKSEYSKLILEFGIANDKAADQVMKNVEAFKQNTKTITDNISKYDKLNKTLEVHGSSVKDSIAKFATLSMATTLLKKAFIQSYEQMSRITQRGMLGAFTSINLMAPKLLLLPEELEKLIDKNRDLVNTFGGGIEGLEKFGKELGNAREGLEYLGREGTRAASRFMEASKVFGLTAKDGKAYNVAMNSMKKQFREFSGLFGDSYEEYANLIETQGQEENYRRRLNGMSKDRIAIEIREIQNRTENLKLMGLSNQQIIEFNKRIEDIYNPRKNTQNQRRVEGQSFLNLQNATQNMLGANPALSAQAQDLQATSGVAKQLAALHSRGGPASGQAIKELLASREGQAFLRANENARNALDNNVSDVGLYGINAMSDRAGSLQSMISSQGLNVNTASQQGRNVGGGDVAAIKASAMQLTGANSMLESGFKATTVAMEGFRSVMGNPFTAAIGGAIAGLFAFGGASKLMAKGVDIITSVLGKGGRVAGTLGKLGVGAKGFGLGAVLGIGGSFAADALGRNTMGGAAADTLGTSAAWAGTGALAGSFIPGVGTAIGGAIGGVAGAGYGLYKNSSTFFGASSGQMPAISGQNMKGASGDVQAAILSAAGATGVDPGLLASFAKKESGFNPNAKASTSSATGLMQFTDSTWLSTIRANGQKHGINVAGMTTDQILGLRNDPRISALMGAELIKSNQKITGDNTAGGAYLAHFLGASGASKILSANPNTPLSALVGADQITANPAVFGKNRTAGDLRSWAETAMTGTGTVATSSSTGAPPNAADAASSELKKQTGLLAIIAQNTSQRLRPSDTAYKADAATVASR